jgi:urease accessory protein UreF
MNIREDKTTRMMTIVWRQFTFKKVSATLTLSDHAVRIRHWRRVERLHPSAASASAASASK